MSFFAEIVFGITNFFLKDKKRTEKLHIYAALFKQAFSLIYIIRYKSKLLFGYTVE